ncbi:uncharacterized protein BO80DRAFT_475202 [Aspergillus ibericus CBS 121593]|uniref:Uncharacterized protein n=1 Tax=Aspergillus ibericus CBS 121593 TaxID=1448316 RepID=A0A395HFX8_9EURO|nr:hypothetical protein BO80DRAFT_475202 [Aspergillus ibericus CBS 121593]RAL06035.1 hypothetical protein BO80DRAFT_475202 [Aspergillus ibericus CBS 121593]
MELILLIVLLVTSINLAHCSTSTGPFEAIFFYYAYRIDAAAAARAAADGVPYEATIGAECMGKDCTLAAFMKTIINSNYVELFKPTAIGETTSPEVYATAEEIGNSWDYVPTLLKSENIIKDPPVGFADMVDAVASKIQQARAVVPSADLVEKAAAALRWAQAIRLTQLVVQKGQPKGSKAKAFAKEYKDITLKVTERELGMDRTVSPALKIVYTDLDYASMAEQVANGDRATLDTTLRGYLNWVQAESGNSVYRNHQNTVNVYQRSVASLEAGCS